MATVSPDRIPAKAGIRHHCTPEAPATEPVETVIRPQQGAAADRPMRADQPPSPIRLNGDVRLQCEIGPRQARRWKLHAEHLRTLLPKMDTSEDEGQVCFANGASMPG
jgi:hypothetical protein